MIKNISLLAIAPANSVVFLKSNRPLDDKTTASILADYESNKELKEKKISVVLLDHNMDIAEAPKAPKQASKTAPKEPVPQALVGTDEGAGGGQNP